MTFTQAEFLIFLTLAIIGYYFFPKKLRPAVLLAESLSFYWISEKSGGALAFIISAAFIAWLVGSGIDRVYNEKNYDGSSDMNMLKAKARPALFAAVFLLIGALVYVKAGSLLVRNFESLSAVKIIVPLGISYYTLSLIGYIGEKSLRNGISLSFFCSLHGFLPFFRDL